ncbi:MAG: hypothetical protein ACK5MV_00125 [Aminipila sp.]
MGNKKYIIVRNIIVCIIIIVAPFILNFIGKCLKPYTSFFISDSSGWLGFLGGYIGGIFTLFGVLLTIYFNQKQLLDDKRLSVIPYLNFSIKPNDDEEKHNNRLELNILFYSCKTYEKEDKISFLLEVENLGIGNALDIYIPRVWSCENSRTDKQSVAINNKKVFYIELNDPFVTTLPEIKFDIFYTDLIGNNYKQNVVLRNPPIKFNGQPEHFISLENFSAPIIV